jgi:hypothetical protein
MHCHQEIRILHKFSRPDGHGIGFGMGINAVCEIPSCSLYSCWLSEEEKNALDWISYENGQGRVNFIRRLSERWQVFDRGTIACWKIPMKCWNYIKNQVINRQVRKLESDILCFVETDWVWVTVLVVRILKGEDGFGSFDRKPFDRTPIGRLIKHRMLVSQPY